jgi:hypothetical protein
MGDFRGFLQLKPLELSTVPRKPAFYFLSTRGVLRFKLLNLLNFLDPLAVKLFGQTALCSYLCPLFINYKPYGKIRTTFKIRNL